MTDKLEKQKVRTQKHAEDYRQWIANGTPKQKALWAKERQIHNKPELRAEYNRIVAQLQAFLPTSKMENGGKYGFSERPSNEAGVIEGLKCHLRRDY